MKKILIQQQKYGVVPPGSGVNRKHFVWADVIEKVKSRFGAKRKPAYNFWFSNLNLRLFSTLIEKHFGVTMGGLGINEWIKSLCVLGIKIKRLQKWKRYKNWSNPSKNITHYYYYYYYYHHYLFIYFICFPKLQL